MKPIDGDKVLSDLYYKMVYSVDVGDAVVKYQDVVDCVRSSRDLPIQYETAQPSTRYRDYNGYFYCSRCNSKVSANDVYCNQCGKKFTDSI
jgi:hypothetical protein